MEAPTKQAKIYGKPYGVSDDGRCRGHAFELYLNDHGGRGFWHGGPVYPSHGKPVSSIDDGVKYAEEHGYTYMGVSYG